MKFTATDPYLLHRPQTCERRVYLHQAGQPAAPPGPYEQVLLRLGERYEAAQLANFPGFLNLAAVPAPNRARETLQAVQAGHPVLYHPWLGGEVSLEGMACEIHGEPDFMLATPAGYAIRDVKLSRRPSAECTPEIDLQLQIYGWLYERNFGHPPARLEILDGTGEIHPFDYAGEARVLDALTDLLRIRTATEEPYSPVGWSKCRPCAFRDHCWSRAEHGRDVARVLGVDQDLAKSLRSAGIQTVEQFLGRFTPETLADFRKRTKAGTRRVGRDAAGILRMARALASGREELLRAPELPSGPNFVMFDLEGLPPQFDELQKIYLWGLQVRGERPGPYEAAVAGFGPDGDRQGWEDFLSRAAATFAAYGDLPFLHWANYEKTHLKMYIRRYGDPQDVAQRVLDNLCDLLEVTQRALALPLPSYGLKVVERYIGFERSQENFGGEWSMAKYIEAVETEDESARARVMDEIFTYNQEDLDATWAVFEWLRTKSRAAAMS